MVENVLDVNLSRGTELCVDEAQAVGQILFWHV